MLEGRELCIMNSPASHPKDQLEKKIVECGGLVVQNPGIDTYCVLADKVNLKVKNIFRWISLCIKALFTRNVMYWLRERERERERENAAGKLEVHNMYM